MQLYGTHQYNVMAKCGVLIMLKLVLYIWITLDFKMLTTWNRGNIKKCEVMCAYVNSSLLGCYDMYKAAIFEPLDSDINAVHSSETSVLTYRSTPSNITRDLNVRKYRHEHCTSRSYVVVNTDTQTISGFLTFWRRIFFFILAHSVYKM